MLHKIIKACSVFCFKCNCWYLKKLLHFIQYFFYKLIESDLFLRTSLGSVHCFRVHANILLFMTYHCRTSLVAANVSALRSFYYINRGSSIQVLTFFFVFRLKSEIKSVYNQKGDIRKNILDTECLEKEMMEKLHRKVCF